MIEQNNSFGSRPSLFRTTLLYILEVEYTFLKKITDYI